MYAEQGDHKAMQGVLDNQTAIEKKNLLLQPLFRDIKSQISHMSKSVKSLLKELNYFQLKNNKMRFKIWKKNTANCWQ
jgi:uncharacterized protein YjbK